MQMIVATFEAHREEKVIANKIKQEFDKQHGKCTGHPSCHQTILLSNLNRISVTDLHHVCLKISFCQKKF